MVALARGLQPDMDELRRLVTAEVKRTGWMLEAYRDIERDDLIQEGMIRANQLHASYEPGRGHYSTLITVGVRRRILDILRGRSREAKRVDVLRQQPAADQGISTEALREIRDWFEAGETAGMPGGMGGDDETLAEWVGKVYRFACGVFPARTGSRGPIGFTRPQRVTVALMMKKRHLSIRGARHVLLADEDLIEAMELAHVPCWRWFGKAMETTARMLEVGHV